MEQKSNSRIFCNAKERTVDRSRTIGVRNPSSVTATGMLTLLPLRLPFPLPVAATLPNAALLLPASTRVSLRQITQGASMNAAAASSAPDAAAAATGEEGAKEAVDVLVQYVVLRRDLADAWPLGSVVAQGCHAAVAAVWAHRDHPDTAAYCAPDNLDRMHKACSTVCLTRVPVSCLCCVKCLPLALPCRPQGSRLVLLAHGI
jgi:hypothetical protein